MSILFLVFIIALIIFTPLSTGHPTPRLPSIATPGATSYKPPGALRVKASVIWIVTGPRAT